MTINDKNHNFFKACILRYPALSVFIFSFLAIAALFSVLGALNYSGFCLSEKHFLSDEEKTKLVFEYINNRDTIPVRTADNKQKNFKQIKYKNFENFLKENPNCCQVGMDFSSEVGPPTFWKKFFGEYADIVKVQFKAKYVDEHGASRSTIKDWDYVMTNCGVRQD